MPLSVTLRLPYLLSVFEDTIKGQLEDEGKKKTRAYISRELNNQAIFEIKKLSIVQYEMHISG